MELLEVLANIDKGLGDTLRATEMTLIAPEKPKRGELPVRTDGKKTILDYSGPRGCARIIQEEKKITLACTNLTADEAGDEDFTDAAVTGLDLSSCDDRDVKYIVNEFRETLEKHFGKKTAQKRTKANMPKPISKSAAKNGIAAYDANTLGSRFVSLFPELREAYHANVEKYGEFLAAEFFENQGGNKAVADTLRGRDPAKIKKMINLFNEIYEDGTNETQSLLCVTVLGSLGNDQEMLDKASEFMSDALKKEVLYINKYLSSGLGRGKLNKLKNPPPYKPKTNKTKRRASSPLGM